VRPHKRAPIFAVIAGEASGDILGAGLIKHLARRVPDASFVGVGGPLMVAEGLSSVFPMSDIAVMGFGAVIKKLPFLFNRLRVVCDFLEDTKPDVIICVDAPDFNHRLARRMKRRCPDIRIIDYVVPSVWFWRSGRAGTMAQYFDHCLALLPFEPEVLKNLGGPQSTFVGHRAIEAVASDAEVAALRAGHDIKPDAQCLVLLPGSRHAEVETLMPIFRQVTEQLRREFGRLRLFMPLVPHLAAELRTQIRDWPYEVICIDDEREKYASLRLADLALAASGTVALEIGLAQTPMIIGYPSSGLFESYIIKFVARAPSVNLVNLVLDRPVVPELLSDNLTADNMLALARNYLSDPELCERTQSALQVFSTIMQKDGNAPDAEAADAVLRIAGFSST